MGEEPVLSAPIGVFDSGIGGLSILQALRAELPHEAFIYVADSGHAPYGERDDAHVIERSRLLTRYLREAHRIKAMVMACNTAAAAAVQALRAEHPGLPIIGVEPALKPAVALSRTRRIGVMATRSTLASAKFGDLLASLAGQAEFVCQPCDGLADAIERSVETQDATKIIALCDQYTRTMGTFGTEDGHLDTLVLGCTHYPFAAGHLRALVGASVHCIDTGAPVARQTRRVLQAGHALATTGAGQVRLCTTGKPETLQAAAEHWLQLQCPVVSLCL